MSKLISLEDYIKVQTEVAKSKVYWAVLSTPQTGVGRIYKA
jgi:hypothetical protein